MLVFIEAASNKGHVTAVLYIVRLNKQLKFFSWHKTLKHFHYWKEFVWVFYIASCLKGQSFFFFCKIHLRWLLNYIMRFGACFFLVIVVNVLYSATVFELKRTNVKTEIKKLGPENKIVYLVECKRNL